MSAADEEKYVVRSGYLRHGFGYTYGVAQDEHLTIGTGGKIDTSSGYYRNYYLWFNATIVDPIRANGARFVGLSLRCLAI